MRAERWPSPAEQTAPVVYLPDAEASAGFEEGHRGFKSYYSERCTHCSQLDSHSKCKSGTHEFTNSGDQKSSSPASWLTNPRYQCVSYSTTRTITTPPTSLVSMVKTHQCQAVFVTGGRLSPPRFSKYRRFISQDFESGSFIQVRQSLYQDARLERIYRRRNSCMLCSSFTITSNLAG